MSRAICHLAPDCSSATLVMDGERRHWRPAPHDAGASDVEQDATRTTLRHIEESVGWVVEHLGSRRRLDALVLGVDDSLCVRVAAPSPDPQVIGAALRRRQEDWGGASGALSVEALVGPEQPEADAEDVGPEAGAPANTSRLTALLQRVRGGAGPRVASGASRHLTVIQLDDAAARLWMDAADRAGVRLGAVMTVWHAIARAATTGAEGLEAVVTIEEDGRTLWSWAEEGMLHCCGAVRLLRDRRTDASDDERMDARLRNGASRLALDWVTWAAQLGRRPSRVRVVGHDAEGLSRRLGEVWPHAPIEAHNAERPVEDALASLAARDESPGAIDDGRRVCAALSARPRRAHRRLYLWSGAALALLALAVGFIGYRFAQWRDDYRRQTGSARGSLIEIMDQRGLPMSEEPIADQRLRTMLDELVSEQRDERREPPAPMPIHQEIAALANVLSERTALEGFKLERLRIDEDGGALNVRAQDVRDLDALREDIRTIPETRLRWTGSINPIGGGAGSGALMRLSGTWEVGE